MYDIFMNDNQNKRPRGRPPLTPEQREESRIRNNKRTNQHHKNTGYASQKKYNESNKESVSEGSRIRSKKVREKYCDLGILILREKRDELNRILEDTSLTITDLFINAVEEKYNISLR